MKTFTITVGLPGSGKSTYADKHFRHALRLERDRMRECLFGDRQRYHGELATKPDLALLVGPTMHKAMLTAMQHRIYDDIILSDTGLAWAAVAQFHKAARSFDMAVNVVYFDLTWGEIVDRNATRPKEHQVPMTVLERFWRMQHAMPLGDEVNEQWWLNPRKVNHLIRINAKGEICG